jgi:uncharacterized protein YbjQ (UPF0145 family)
MLITTTNSIEGKNIQNYLGIITGETILGANFFKDWKAGLTNVFGGRSGAYEASLQEARDSAMDEMQNKAKKLGANAIIGVDLDYSSIEVNGSNMMMVNCSGTAVVIN